MRKALFAILLVFAAFAGGAAVNGPGLDWLKSAGLAAMRDRLKPAGNVEHSRPEVAGQRDDQPEAIRPPTPFDRANPSDAKPLPVVGSDANYPATLPSSAIEVASPAPKSDAPPVALAMPEPMVDPAVVPASTPADARDWSDLRRRMRELGITRYEVEGETSGRSRFRCLIPLAGRRAVGQQFEGEGDNDFQAAESALRRVVLWRATEMTPP